MAEEIELQLWQTVQPVEFIPEVKDRNEAQALLISTRQGAGYQIAGGQLSHAIQSRATHVLMDFSQNACAIRYQVDGNWEQLPPLDRETGDAMLYALKQLCLLNPADRRSAQTGKMKLKLAKDKYRLTMQSQGVPTGERVLTKIEAEKIPFENLADLGMRDKMISELKEQLNAPGNLVVITAPKSEGLTTSWDVVMGAADKFVRDFQAIEDQATPEPEIINVSSNYYGGDTGITQLDLLKRMILKEPDVFVFPELPQPESLQLALQQVAKLEKSIYTRFVSDNAMNGLVQLLNKYKDSAKEIAGAIGCVLNQRLVRRLCDNCKVGFEPPPKLLAQLGIPAGRVAMLYQPFVPPPIEQQVDENGRPAPIEPCHACAGRGYMGRIAIFELLRPGKELRAAVLKTRDTGQLYNIAKQEGHRGIQSEAVLTVARGLTSLDELKRVFSKR
ncbi:putative type II secretion system protein E [Novipirellula aureliae]|uniref:Putative type II secretion system protein E n=1 Tax=Novipirellula aureliae TaxID=2527966 RepID=A0A5C6E2M5_9BACT|nr:ATPase, T2SS/T4P/T4SS family [Novipirellula aureliae]TWU43160.1 putative type II secretion system protein E [Novipirellula aureliae]